MKILLITLSLASTCTFSQESNIDSIQQFFYDEKTDLTWTKCFFGQKWTTQDKCQGQPRKLTYEQARKITSDVWRTPTKKELMTLKWSNIEKYQPNSNHSKNPTSSITIWSIDKYADGSAWYMNFANDSINNIYGDYDFLSEKMHVILVHQGQPLLIPKKNITNSH